MNNTQKKIVICATMDTKGRETMFLKGKIEELGVKVNIIDVGLKRSNYKYDVAFTQDQVSLAAGYNFDDVINIVSRSDASQIMITGLKSMIQKLFLNGEFDGIISIGGSGGTTIASAAMQSLPLGIPKIIVGTMASGNTVPYVQGLDILLINSVVDIQSLNFMSEYILGQAAAIICAMINGPKLTSNKKKAIGITCFGVTTPCVQRCKDLLEARGYEVLIFHARGVSGGKIMEKMIQENFFSGVLDITTTEVIDEVAGGAYSIGPNRLRAGVQANIPYIVVPGALEMINIGPKELLKPNQSQKTRYYHTPSLLKIRADKQDMLNVANIFVHRLSDSRGNSKLIIPTKGFSEIDKDGNVFFDLETDNVFIENVKAKMPCNVPIICENYHINDPEFAEILVNELFKMIECDVVLGN